MSFLLINCFEVRFNLSQFDNKKYETSLFLGVKMGRRTGQRIWETIKYRVMSPATYRVLKCDVTNICIFAIMEFVSIFGKSTMKNTYLLKISILLQFGGEILALLCPDDSIQILLILSHHFRTLFTGDFSLKGVLSSKWVGLETLRRQSKTAI